jgi:outer membrane protein TolC
VSKSFSLTIVCALALAFASNASAQGTFDLEAVKRAALAQAQAQTRPQTPGASGPVIDLRLDEAVQRALDNNLDLAVERLNPRTYDYSLSALYGTYRPSLTSTFGNRSAITLPSSQLTGVADKLSTDTLTWVGGITQNVRWGGGSLSAGFSNNRTDSSNLFATRNPTYSTSLVFNYTQPLLRNFRTDSTRTSLLTTKISQDISELQLKATATVTAASVRMAYYDLIAARRAIEVAQQSLELASTLVSDNQQRVEIGTLASIEVFQAQAEEATRRQTLVLAEATARTAELALKRLIVSGTEDPLWSASINPVDRPVFAPRPIDVNTVVKNALDNRLDLQQAKRTLESNDLSIKNLSNQTLPALDLTGGYSLAGLGGTEFKRSGLGGSISDIIPGGYWQALTNISGFVAPTWNLQLNISYPLGTSSADASVARAKLQLQQTRAQTKKIALQIATEVTNTALTVRSNEQRVQTSTVARDLSQKRLEAEQSKFKVGLSTNFLVVQAQRDLFTAQIAELQAILDYVKSLVDLERVQITGSGGSVSSISAGGGGTGATTSGTTGGTTSGARVGG